MWPGGAGKEGISENSRSWLKVSLAFWVSLVGTRSLEAEI